MRTRMLPLGVAQLSKPQVQAQRQQGQQLVILHQQRDRVGVARQEPARPHPHVPVGLGIAP